MHSLPSKPNPNRDAGPEHCLEPVCTVVKVRFVARELLVEILGPLRELGDESSETLCQLLQGQVQAQVKQGHGQGQGQV